MLEDQEGRDANAAPALAFEEMGTSAAGTRVAMFGDAALVAWSTMPPPPDQPRGMLELSRGGGTAAAAMVAVLFRECRTAHDEDDFALLWRALLVACAATGCTPSHGEAEARELVRQAGGCAVLWGEAARAPEGIAPPS